MVLRGQCVANNEASFILLFLGLSTWNGTSCAFARGEHIVCRVLGFLVRLESCLVSSIADICLVVLGIPCKPQFA